jgi:ABC-type glycerol-3-phosphate transport system substrate-binding protein
VDRQPNGRFVNATGRPEFIEALEYIVRLLNEGLIMPRPEDANWNWHVAAFADGRVATRIEPVWARNSLQTMPDDWGMVMFPRGPRVNDFVVFASEHVLVIPATSSQAEVEKTFAAIDLWNRPIDNSPYAWQNPHWPLFRDTRAVTETLAIIRDPARARFQHHLMIPGLNRGDIAWSIWYIEGNPGQLVEAISAQWNAIIDDLNFDLGL